jgi:Bacterial dnaA protein helix-turn-helix
MLLWYIRAMIRHNENDRLTMNPCTPRPSAGPYVTPQLKRAIAARWKVWVPWVRLLLLRAHQSDPAVDVTEDGADSRRLHQHHSDHILDMLRVGISMRTVRRHRLDDPRITDEVRKVLVEAAMERQSKAWYRRPDDKRAEDRMATLISLGPVVRNDAPKDANDEYPETRAPAVAAVPDPQPLRDAIQAIRRHVCEHFYLREMRDPELTARTHGRAYVLPRQIAMYLVSQLTGASLQEIGQEFGNRHHATVLHSIGKIEEMRCSDEALNCAITRLMEACVKPCACEHRRSRQRTLEQQQAITASRTPLWLASGRGFRGRRLSKA